jgi:predicted RNA-binding Zn ribbon-like protein
VLVMDSWRGYLLIAGHVSLDLVNTVSWRLDPGRTVDRLPMPGFLPTWLARAGLAPTDQVTSLSPENHADVITRLSELRETVYRLVTSTSPERQDLAHFGELLTAAQMHAVATPSLPLRWTVPVEQLDDVVPALTLSADDLLRSPEAPLVRQCSGAGCGWLFIDRTRNHSRQWCSSQDCGNRERARRHYQKTRDQAAAPHSV